jgi:hypothetical protein
MRSFSIIIRTQRYKHSFGIIPGKKENRLVTAGWHTPAANKKALPAAAGRALII